MSINEEYSEGCLKPTLKKVSFSFTNAFLLFLSELEKQSMSSIFSVKTKQASRWFMDNYNEPIHITQIMRIVEGISKTRKVEIIREHKHLRFVFEKNLSIEKC